jgi:hypothetical protein
MKKLDNSTGKRERIRHLLHDDRNATPVWQSWFSFASGFPDRSRFLAIEQRIPSITLPPDRPQLSRILCLTLTFGSVGFLGSCTEVSSKVGIPINVTPISQIVKNPKVGSSVNIKGTVTQQAPFLKGGAYQIKDETGKIWVMRDSHQESLGDLPVESLRERPLPNPGDSLTIKGIVQYESIPIGKQEFGEVYLDEQKQLE